MSVEIRGFEDVVDDLDRVSGLEGADAGEVDVSIADLFPRDFMEPYTAFVSVQAFFEASPWTVETESDFDDIPEDALDKHVDANTGFRSWETMLTAAAREWILRKIAA